MIRRRKIAHLPNKSIPIPDRTPIPVVREERNAGIKRDPIDVDAVMKKGDNPQNSLTTVPWGHNPFGGDVTAAQKKVLFRPNKNQIDMGVTVKRNRINISAGINGTGPTYPDKNPRRFVTKNSESQHANRVNPDNIAYTAAPVDSNFEVRTEHLIPELDKNGENVEMDAGEDYVADGNLELRLEQPVNPNSRSRQSEKIVAMGQNAGAFYGSGYMGDISQVLGFTPAFSDTINSNYGSHPSRKVNSVAGNINAGANYSYLPTSAMDYSKNVKPNREPRERVTMENYSDYSGTGQMQSTIVPDMQTLTETGRNKRHNGSYGDELNTVNDYTADDAYGRTPADIDQSSVTANRNNRNNKAVKNPNNRNAGIEDDVYDTTKTVDTFVVDANNKTRRKKQVAFQQDLVQDMDGVTQQTAINDHIDRSNMTQNRRRQAVDFNNGNNVSSANSVNNEEFMEQALPIIKTAKTKQRKYQAQSGKTNVTVNNEEFAQQQKPIQSVTDVNNNRRQQVQSTHQNSTVDNTEFLNQQESHTDVKPQQRKYQAVSNKNNPTVDNDEFVEQSNIEQPVTVQKRRYQAQSNKRQGVIDNQEFLPQQNNETPIAAQNRRYQAASGKTIPIVDNQEFLPQANLEQPTEAQNRRHQAQSGKTNVTLEHQEFLPQQNIEPSVEIQNRRYQARSNKSNANDININEEIANDQGNKLPTDEAILAQRRKYQARSGKTAATIDNQQAISNEKGITESQVESHRRKYQGQMTNTVAGSNAALSEQQLGNRELIRAPNTKFQQRQQAERDSPLINIRMPIDADSKVRIQMALEKSRKMVSAQAENLSAHPDVSVTSNINTDERLLSIGENQVHKRHTVTVEGLDAQVQTGSDATSRLSADREEIEHVRDTKPSSVSLDQLNLNANPNINDNTLTELGMSIKDALDQRDLLINREKTSDKVNLASIEISNPVSSQFTTEILGVASFAIPVDQSTLTQADNKKHTQTNVEIIARPSIEITDEFLNKTGQEANTRKREPLIKPEIGAGAIKNVIFRTLGDF